MTFELSRFAQQEQELKKLRIQEEAMAHKLKTVLDYISAKGSVKANGIQISWDLSSELSMTSSEMALFLSDLERFGHLKYENGKYIYVADKLDGESHE